MTTVTWMLFNIGKFEISAATPPLRLKGVNDKVLFFFLSISRAVALLCKRNTQSYLLLLNNLLNNQEIILWFVQWINQDFWQQWRWGVRSKRMRLNYPRLVSGSSICRRTKHYTIIAPFIPIQLRQSPVHDFKSGS